MLCNWFLNTQNIIEVHTRQTTVLLLTKNLTDFTIISIVFIAVRTDLTGRTKGRSDAFVQNPHIE